MQVVKDTGITDTGSNSIQELKIQKVQSIKNTSKDETYKPYHLLIQFLTILGGGGGGA